MARHDREDPHSLEEQLAWLDAIKETEDPPAPVTITVDETVVSPYPKDPWSLVPAESAPPSSPLFRAAGDPAHGGAQPDDPAERAQNAQSAQSETTEIRPSALEGLDRWGASGDSSPFVARDNGGVGERGVTGTPSGGAFGTLSPPSPGGGGLGAFGERPASSGGAFGESSTGAFAGPFGDRPVSSGGSPTQAFGDRPGSSGGAFGEPTSSLTPPPPPASPSAPAEAEPPASGRTSPAPAPAEPSVSDDTDSFTFGSLTDLTEKPGREATFGWISVSSPPKDDKAARDDRPVKDDGAAKPERAENADPLKRPEPEPDVTGDQSVRGWLEAALPASETAETDPEQERFNAFVNGGTTGGAAGAATGGATGMDTEDVVVPRVEQPLYEQRPEQTSPSLQPPATSAPSAAASTTQRPESPQPSAAPAQTPEPAAGAARTTTPSAEPGADDAEGRAEEREPYRPRRRQAPRPAAEEFEPAFSPPARSSRAKGAAATAPGTRPTADSLDPVTLLRGRRNAPAGGWRKIVYKASAGLIKPGESPEVRRRRELVTRARTPVATGHHRVAVLSLKGGVGKTTTTVGLGATLASVRGDRVIAVDANPDRGTLSDKVELETSATVRDLLNERQQIKRYVDIRAFTSQAPSRLEILASDRDPSVSEAFSAVDYQAVAQVLENFYSICITDCGTGLLHSAMSGVLGLADQLVLVSSPSVDGARAASATLDWLEAHHYADLVKAATVVLCSVRPRSKSTVDLDKLESHFAARCRAVIRVPYDPHLEEGAEIDLDRLQPATRQAYLLLAASVGDGFGGIRR
ncbi:MinD/ParA family protein [Sphaerisporangium sp. NPDC051011]|uniref:MinD/ParA family ATP-binding protein n=1 Tax=Sphaerisporangium sp. NPDC051011 TaxID=3155792 RepID=UPI0033FD2991